MQLPNQRLDVTTGGIGETAAFKINASAKMFSILGDKIYSDKPRAVVREISTNAYDIHIATGQTKPFLVILPVTQDPNLIIRDFGTGLTHDQVVNHYTTYFDSSKMEDAKQAGALGLGSKSPFAYCDMFTVTSFQGGQKRVYMIFKDEDQMPQITLVSTSETDAEDGLEVRVPVAPADFEEFKTAACRVLKFFPEDSYRLIGAVVTPPDLSWDWGWLAEFKTPWNQRSLVQMGPVAYEVDWSLLPEALANIAKTRLLFRVPMGSVDILPSREGLSMDKHTIRYLSDLVHDFVDKSHDALLKEIDAPTEWEQVCNINRLKSSILKNTATGHYKFTGEFKPHGGLRPRVVESDSVNPKSLRGRWVASSVEPQERWRIMIADQTTRLGFRVHALYEETNFSNLLIVSPLNPEQYGQEMADSIMQDFLKQVPAGKLHYASDYQPPVLQTKTKRGPAEIPVVYEMDGSNPVSLVPGSCKEVMEQGGIYVPMTGTQIDEGFVPMLHGSSWVENIPVYGLTKRARSLVDDENFQRLDEFLIECFNDLTDVEEKIAESEWLSEVKAEYHQLITVLRKIGKPLGDPFFDAAWELCEKLAHARPPYEWTTIRSIRRLEQLELIEPLKIPDISNRNKPFDRLLKRRPLFAYMIQKITAYDENVEFFEKSLKVKG